MEGKEVEDVDCEAKVGCDCVATFDGSNKCTNCTYTVSVVSKKREITDTTMELNNNKCVRFV